MWVRLRPGHRVADRFQLEPRDAVSVGRGLLLLVSYALAGQAGLSSAAL